MLISWKMWFWTCEFFDKCDFFAPVCFSLVSAKVTSKISKVTHHLPRSSVPFVRQTFPYITKKHFTQTYRKKVVIWGSRKLYVLTVSYSFAHLSNNERKLYTVLTMKASTRTKASTRPQPQRTKHSAVVTTDESNDASRHSACSSVSKWLVLKTRPMRLSTILSNKWW